MPRDSETQDDAGAVKEVRLQTSEYASGAYDEIRVIMADLHLTATITSDRDIRLAQRLAKAHGVEVYDCRRKGGLT